MIQPFKFAHGSVSAGLCSIAGLSMGMGVCANSYAQQATAQGASATPGPVLEEITVTSRRFEESLQRAPLSVTAMSSVRLQEMQITGVEGLQKLAPNMYISENVVFPGQISPTIRGIGTDDSEPSWDPAVAVVVDGIVFSSIYGSMPTLFDTERVEVLRGPQGTTFGRNSVGGVVNVITRKPTGEFGVRAQVTAGNYGQLDYAGRLDFAISETVAGKISIEQIKNDGVYSGHYVADITTPLLLSPTQTYSPDFDPNAAIAKAARNGLKDGEVDVLTVRPAVTWRPENGAVVTLSGEFYRNESDAFIMNFSQPGPQATPYGELPADLMATVLGSVGPDPRHLNDSARSFNSNYPSTNKYEATGAYLNASIPLGAGELNIDTGYRESTLKSDFDTEGSALDVFNVLRDLKLWQASLETRYIVDLNDRWNLLVGAYYLDDGYDQGGSFAGAAYAPFGFYRTFGVSQQRREASAAFATIEAKLSERWSASVGGRYSYESKEFEFAANGFCTGLSRDFDNCSRNPAGYAADSENWDDFSPKVLVNFQLSDDVMFYGSWSRAFRSGGFNGRAAVPAAIGPYDPETVDSYELGGKSTLADGRLRVNGAVFFNQYDDMQRNSLLGAGLLLIANAAKVEIKGAELEVDAKPFDQIDLRLHASVGYLDTEYTEYLANFTGVAGQDFDLSGQPLQNAPEWTSNVDASYAVPLAGGDLTFRAAYSYLSAMYLTPDLILDAKREAGGLLDASVSYEREAGAGAWTVTLFSKNILDDIYMENVKNQIGLFNVGRVNAPRQYGVTLGFRY